MNSSIANRPENVGSGRPPPEFDRRVHDLYDYWESKRVGERVPDRSEMDPIVDIPRLLSAVWLVDVEWPDLRLKYRLIGSDLPVAGAVSKVGQYIEDQPNRTDMYRTIDALRKVASDGIPFWRTGPPELQHDKFVANLQVLSLPLRVKGSERVEMLMNMTIFQWTK